MNGHELGPALGPCEVPVGHPALDVEGGLYVRLPRTTPLYLFLVDVQGFVDRECLVGPEDGPAVGDDGFGRAVALHRRVKDREVRREILAAKDPTCEDRPAVVLQNRDDVDVASQPVLYVARTSVIQYSCRLEEAKGISLFSWEGPLSLSNP